MNDTIEAGGFTVEFVGPPIAKVELVIQPEGAVAGLATIVRGYKQVYDHRWPPFDEQDRLLDDINRTKLHTPLEMLSYTWLVRDVTRAWTHQAVRTRVGAAYVQESMRFSDKRVAKVLVPPAISADANRLGAYRETVAEAFQTYATMVADGVPIQDARGVLPHNVLTHIFVSYTLSTLAKTASLRYCCQAQNMKADGEGEWKTVLEQMRASLPDELQRFVCAPWEAGEVSCGFEASFDRPCAWPERFQPNLDALLARRKVPAGQETAPSTPTHPTPPVLPVSVPLPLRRDRIYTNADGTLWMDVRGTVLEVSLLARHLRGRFYDEVNLYDRYVKEAKAGGAQAIHVIVRDRVTAHAIGLAQFEVLAEGGDFPNSHKLGLDERWRLLAAQDI